MIKQHYSIEHNLDVTFLSHSQPLRCKFEQCTKLLSYVIITPHASHTNSYCFVIFFITDVANLDDSYGYIHSPFVNNSYSSSKVIMFTVLNIVPKCWNLKISISLSKLSNILMHSVLGYILLLLSLYKFKFMLKSTCISN